ncbi:MAG TPA: 4-hydroxy-tetrahydrodipicolinate synthase [Phycisphaerales bacterium]|nr:4-hydroxy-tetrahydrodipicolinate synthase [Phycisphaerales bacterium]
MDETQTLFRGAFTALVTPFNTDASAVDYASYERNIREQAAAGISGIVPCGTTGESPTLTEEEHHELVQKAVELARPLGLSVIAGAGSNSTAHAIELHKFARSAGADASLQVNPYYNKPSQEGLYRHFMSVADSAELPICLYNIPGRTGVALTPETVERLAKHPNIQAIKEATGSLDSASEILARTELALLSGDDSLTLPFASVGGVGVVSVISNILPAKTAALCEAFNSGDFERAREIHFELLPVARGLLSLDTNPVPVKAAMQLMGKDTGALRLPMCQTSAGNVAMIRKLLAAADLLPATVTA